MNSSQQTRLENFTPEEKTLVAAIFRKKILLKSVIYLFLIGGSIFILVYFNFFTQEFENIWLLNLAFGVNIALCGRIYIGEISEYRKEVSSPVKKIVDTRIVSRDGNKITIGNQQFKKEDILLGVPDFDTLRAGDPVKVEHSAKSHTLCSVKKV